MNSFVLNAHLNVFDELDLQLFPKQRFRQTRLDMCPTPFYASMRLKGLEVLVYISYLLHGLLTVLHPEGANKEFPEIAP